MRHQTHLDGLRGAAALWVLLSHLWLEVWPVYYGLRPHGVTAWATGWMLYAHFAVDVFIVLSGYCLMLPVCGRGELSGGAVKFYLKRARRILPPFYLALAFSFVLAKWVVNEETRTHWDISLPATRWGLLSNLLLVQDMWRRGEINHAFWSIAVEWRIYFLFPLLVMGFRRIGGTATTLAFTAGAYAVAFATRWTEVERAVPHYVALFAFGCLAAHLAEKGLGDRPLWRKVSALVAFGLAAAVAVACVRWGWTLAQKRFIYLDGAVGVATAALLVYLSGPGAIRSAFSWRPLVFVGTFAYSLYLIHAPLIQVVWQLAVRPFGLTGLPAFLVLASIGIPAILAASYLFFLGCERPFMTRKRQPATSDTLGVPHPVPVAAP